MASTDTDNNSFLPDLCNSHAVLVVVVVSQLLALVMVLTVALYGGFSWVRLALLSLGLLWLSLTAAAILCFLRPLINRLSRQLAAVMVVVVVVADTWLLSVLAGVLHNYLDPSLPLVAKGFWSDVWIKSAIATIITGMLMRYFYVQEQLRQQEKARLLAQIQALQSRIRPHFLFNSMNSIASLIAIDPDGAERMVEDLSALFRASLSDVGSQITLAEELALCERYIHIEKRRLGERLQLDWQVEADTHNITIPLLLLQPLVENALYHGIQPLPKGGTLTLAVSEQAGEVQIRIANPCPEGGSQKAGNRMALENIRHRLHALYGDSALLKVLPGNGHYEVQIRYRPDELKLSNPQGQ